MFDLGSNVSFMLLLLHVYLGISDDLVCYFECTYTTHTQLQDSTVLCVLLMSNRNVNKLCHWLYYLCDHW